MGLQDLRKKTEMDKISDGDIWQSVVKMLVNVTDAGVSLGTALFLMAS